MRDRSNDAPGSTLGNFACWLIAVQADLLRLARSLTESASDAADLLQATNLRALEKRALFVHGAAGDLRRWLFRIMGNLHKDVWRRDSRQLPSGWLDKVAAPEEAPQRWITLDDDEVSVAVNSLDPCLREVYRMYAVERFSYETISSRLRIPRSTVATRIFRARARLRAKLGEGEQVAA